MKYTLPILKLVGMNPIPTGTILMSETLKKGQSTTILFHDIMRQDF